MEKTPRLFVVGIRGAASGLTWRRVPIPRAFRFSTKSSSSLSYQSCSRAYGACSPDGARSPDGPHSHTDLYHGLTNCYVYNFTKSSEQWLFLLSSPRAFAREEYLYFEVQRAPARPRAVWLHAPRPPPERRPAAAPGEKARRTRGSGFLECRAAREIPLPLRLLEIPICKIRRSGRINFAESAVFGNMF